MVLNVKQAAARAGISVSLLNKLRTYGGGPTYLKIGRVVRYDAADLDLWLDGRKRTSTWAANDNRKTEVAA
jgi:predicted DNA-binding transcriptional regulator AlpA